MKTADNSSVAPEPDTRDGAARSGLMLISDNNDALVARILAARSASRTLDLMYYIWRSDRTGTLLAKEIVKAAERGVKVRILIDDVNPQSSDDAYIALDRHPNIELKLFNPSRIRNGNVFRRLEFLYRLFAMTRRMHTKAWIADGEVAISGGRNVGDEYFNASDTNFRDLDLLSWGEVSAQLLQLFESFWNFPASKAVRQLNSKSAATGRSGTDDPHFAEDVLQTAARYRTIDEFAAAGEMHWIDTARVIADPPDKVHGKDSQEWLVNKLLPIFRSSSERLEIISPYFIPGRRGTEVLKTLASQGVSVAVLTNSLAATDVAAVHGAYAKYRALLLRKGIELFEFRPSAGPNKISVFGSKGVSLHTKSFTVDDRIGFVGSFNFDPRSRSLNAEMGIVFEDSSLVHALKQHFRHEVDPEVSYRVFLSKRRLRWAGGRRDKLEVFKSEPEAGPIRRLTAFVVRFLPIESQL